jgi:hypothetical protein
MFLLPAAEKYHDANAGGIVRHTFQVAIIALNRMAERSLPWKDRLAQLIVIILHDIGKQEHVRVTAQDDSWTVLSDDDGKPLVWNPHRTSLARWCYENKANSITVTWMPGRHQSGGHSVEPLGAWFPDKYFHSEICRLIGHARTNSILMALTASIVKPDHDYYKPFKEADGQAIKLHRPPSANIHVDVVRAIAGEMDTFTKCNHPQADVFVSTTHMLLVLPHFLDGDQDKDVLARAGSVLIRAMRQVGLPCLSPDAVVQATRNLLDDSTIPFVRDAREERLYDSRRFRLKYPSENGPGLETKIVAILPLNALYPGKYPARFPGRWTAPVHLHSLKENTPGGITPGDLGFTALPEGEEAKNEKEGKAAAPSPPITKAALAKNQSDALKDVTYMWTKLVAAGAGNPDVAAEIAEHGRITGKTIYAAISDLRKRIDADGTF